MDIRVHPHTDWLTGTLFFLMISFPMDVFPTSKNAHLVAGDSVHINGILDESKV